MHEEEFYQAVGSLIRDRRIKIPLTQAALGALVGLTRTSITNLERGRQKVPLHRFYLIAKALRITPVQLLPKILPRDEHIDSATEALESAEKNFILDVLTNLKTPHDEDSTKAHPRLGDPNSG